MTKFELFKALLDTADAKLDRWCFSVDKTFCRIYSMHIHSDMQKPSKGYICFKAFEGFIWKFRRFHPKGLYVPLEADFPELAERYFK
ncbi:MAG: hypothetical protein LBW85_03495 [Deltaproteobacteria bacterium]|nr:hypothetical protein [Deltaproteobacteria bacterium]